MPYTRKSLAFFWLITFGLLALAASGAVAGPWLLLLVLVALAAPAILRSPAAAAMVGLERPPVVADVRDRSRLGLGRVDLNRWDDEGGAVRAPRLAQTAMMKESLR